MSKRAFQRTSYAVAAMLIWSASSAQEVPIRELYWGDTHVHTTFSTDAYMLGNRSVGPDEAYRFAKGEAVAHPATGTPVQLSVPLDFLVVADHARGLGALRAIDGGDKGIADTLIGRFFQKALDDGTELQAFERLAAMAAADDADGSKTGERIVDQASIGAMLRVGRSGWYESVEIGDRHYDPGTFTALLGWEWSPMPGGAALHRVVIMKEDATVAKKFVPFGGHMSERPEVFWSWLESTSRRNGASFLAIPHNPNVSRGQMFDRVDSDGKPISTEYARTRSMWEPLVEITQMKGDSETNEVLSPTDEFANFEPYKFNHAASAEELVSAGSFVRSGLKRGLEIERVTGANPYKLGVIGSTDTHTGLSTSREDAFAGKFARNSEPENMYEQAAPEGSRSVDFGAAGLAAVWADENSREGIFDALQRKEVYATTGTRIRLRVFGCWDFSEEDIGDGRDLAEIGYTKGVPMGSDLPARAGDAAPTFLLYASKDPNAANLDRIQIVKGWIDETGASHEKVFDAVVSPKRERKSGEDGAVGSTVDLKNATYTNTIGNVVLQTVWTDPEFSASQAAFYYARVLEIPTPRHTLYAAVSISKPHSDDHPATLQERAYSSPIWYTP